MENGQLKKEQLLKDIDKNLSIDLKNVVNNNALVYTLINKIKKQMVYFINFILIDLDATGLLPEINALAVKNGTNYTIGKLKINEYRTYSLEFLFEELEKIKFHKNYVNKYILLEKHFNKSKNISRLEKCELVSNEIEKLISLYAMLEKLTNIYEEDLIKSGNIENIFSYCLFEINKIISFSKKITDYNLLKNIALNLYKMPLILGSTEREVLNSLDNLSLEELNYLRLWLIDKFSLQDLKKFLSVIDFDNLTEDEQIDLSYTEFRYFEDGEVKDKYCFEIIELGKQKQLI